MDEPMGARPFSGLITPFRPPLDFLASRIGSEDGRPGILSLRMKTSHIVITTSGPVIQAGLVLDRARQAKPFRLFSHRTRSH